MKTCPMLLNFLLYRCYQRGLPLTPTKRDMQSIRRIIADFNKHSEVSSRTSRKQLRHMSRKARTLLSSKIACVAHHSRYQYISVKLGFVYLNPKNKHKLGRTYTLP